MGETLKHEGGSEISKVSRPTVIGSIKDVYGALFDLIVDVGGPVTEQMLNKEELSNQLRNLFKAIFRCY